MPGRAFFVPLVEIGLTDLPKSGCAMAHPAHPGSTGLQGIHTIAINLSQSGLIAGFLSNRFVKGLFLQSKIFATDKKHFVPTQGRKTSEKELV